MRSLSKREVILIYIAVLLVIIYGGNWLLEQPAKKAYEESSFRLEQLKAQKKMVEYDLLSITEMKREYETEAEEVKTSLKQFSVVSSRSDLEEYLLTYLERKNMEPVGTSMMDEEFQIKTKEEDNYEGSIKNGSIEVNAIGDKEDFLQLIDEIYKDPILAVSSCSVYQEKQPGNRMNFRIEFSYASPGSLKDVGRDYGETVKQ